MAEYSNERIEKVFKDFSSAIQKTWMGFVAFKNVIEKTQYAIYEKAGCPYGRNPAGYTLWFEE
jgi:hypothetical protein